MGTGVKLPTDPTERKKIPIYSGVLKYFPDAIAAVAAVSFAGNEQHNPGEPLHWARHKSTDQEDTLARHLMEAGSVDTDGHRHSAKAAWRALAILQLEIEAARETPIFYPILKQEIAKWKGGAYTSSICGDILNSPMSPMIDDATSEEKRRGIFSKVQGEANASKK
jgi:Domain of unknown function (DUF5664)